MNGHDIKQYENLKIRAKENGMQVDCSGDRVVLRLSASGENIGFFESIDRVWSCLYGYEIGFQKGLLSKQKILEP